MNEETRGRWSVYMTKRGLAHLPIAAARSHRRKKSLPQATTEATGSRHGTSTRAAQLATVTPRMTMLRIRSLILLPPIYTPTATLSSPSLHVHQIMTLSDDD
jgi:hypothetical protein